MSKSAWRLSAAGGLLLAFALSSCEKSSGGGGGGGGADGGGGGVGAGSFVFRVTGASLAATGASTVTFEVVNPSSNTAYDITNAAEFDEKGTPAASLRLQVGWPVEVYTNENSGAGAPGSSLQIDLLADATAAALTRNANGSFTWTGEFPDLPADAVDAGVALEGHPVQNGATVAVTTAVEYFPVGGAGTTPASPVAVTIDKCNACHAALDPAGFLTAHGGNRADNYESCAMCHNPQATDKRRANNAPGGAADDTSIDGKWMFHVIHAGAFRRGDVTLYGFSASGPSTAHTFPAASLAVATLSQCETCHLPGRAGMTALSNKIDGLGATRAPLFDTTVDANDIPNLADNVRLSARVAVCSSCHDQVSFTDATLPECSAPNPVGGCFHSFAGATANCDTCHGTTGFVNGHN